ncbi:MAG: hypothetical protein AAF638_07325 [Pseudomonadota bacterium]
MQPRPAPLSTSVSAAQSLPRQRLLPVMHLDSFDLAGMVHETSLAFDAPLSFGPVTGAQSAICPAEWLGERIEDALSVANALGNYSSPIHVSAPMPALGHADTPSACEAAVRRARACPQEICLEFEDAAYCANQGDALRHVSTLRGRGFRIGIDARKSWQATTTPPLRMLIDSIRIKADDLDIEADLASRVADVAAEGVCVITDGARWRDRDALTALGVSLAISPKADA